MPDSSKNRAQFCAIELGTHSIKILIAEARDDGTLDIIAHAETESLKILKGEIQGAAIVEEQLQMAFEEIQRNYGIDVASTFVGIVVSGSYIHQDVTSAEIEVTSENGIITDTDIEKVIQLARMHDISTKYHGLSTSVRYYVLSENRTLLMPERQASKTLKAVIQVISALKSPLQTVMTLVGNCLGRPVNDLWYTPMVLGSACLTHEDLMGDGRVLIDIGAGVTSYAVMTAAGCHTAGQLTVGMDHVCNDISLAFGIPIDYARRVLNVFSEHGWSIDPLALASKTEYADVEQGPGLPVHRVSVRAMERVAFVRMRELFEIIDARLEADENARQWGNGAIWLSGGGALLPGVLDVASAVFGRRVVLVHPKGFSGPEEITGNPAYVTVMGELRKAYESLELYKAQRAEEEGENLSGLTKIFTKLKTLFRY